MSGIYVGIVLPEHPSAGDQRDMEHHLQSLKTRDLSLFLFPLANMEMCSLEARKGIQDWWYTWDLLCTMLCQDWWHYLGPAVHNAVAGSRVGRLALSGSGEQWPGQRDEDTTSGLIFKQVFRQRRCVCL